MSIIDFQSGESVNQTFLLKKFEIKTAKNNKRYLDAVLGDRTGEINAKKWDVDDALISSFVGREFARVVGTVELYNSSLQLRIEKLAPAIPGERELEGLIESAPFPPAKMYEKILAKLDEIKDDDIRTLTKHMFEAQKEKLMYFPAAKSYHHAIRGGLLYHTYTMLRGASALLDIYDYLDRDLVYAGVVLHDLGKIKEMVATELGTVADYTAEGNLLGHIITMVCDIDQTARELGTDPQKALLLKHIILSHHLIPEYGSPKPPMFGEAELVHYLDVLDARMNQFEKNVRLQPEGSFTKVYNLDSRTIYNHGLTNDTDESKEN